MISFFPNVTATVYEYTESDINYNIYGEPDEQYVPIGTYKCDFQPTSSSEIVEIEGTIYNDTYKLYLPFNAIITSSCRVMIDDILYDILGSPLVYDHIPNIKHIKCILIKHRKN